MWMLTPWACALPFPSVWMSRRAAWPRLAGCSVGPVPGLRRDLRRRAGRADRRSAGTRPGAHAAADVRDRLAGARSWPCTSAAARRLLPRRQPEQPLVERGGEAPRRLVVHRPGGADEVADAALEERLREARREADRAVAGAVGVIPDSQAFENTNSGTRSMRRSSRADSDAPPPKIQPDAVGSSWS